MKEHHLRETIPLRPHSRGQRQHPWVQLPVVSCLGSVTPVRPVANEMLAAGSENSASNANDRTLSCWLWSSMKPSLRAVSLLLGCILVFVTSTRAVPETFKISGHVLKSSGKNVVYVALWQADGFLKNPVQQIRIEHGAEPVFHFDVAGGRWALRAFEDRNHNGVLDTGLFGPTEPSGFWHAFTGHHKPRFDEVAFLVDRDIDNADISLK